MKCNHCGSEWNVNPSISASMTQCPFCGKSLEPERKKLQTVEDVLVEINRVYGMKILADDRKLTAYFMDLAPQLTKQQRILRYFVECGGPGKILAVREAAVKEQSVCVMQLVSEMKSEMFIEEAASRMVCEAFLYAVTGNRLQGSSRTAGRGGNQQLDSVQPPLPADSAQALFQQGEAYRKSQQYSQAYSLFHQAAQKDYAPAQVVTGLMLLEGQGVTRDHQQAYSWFLKAANQGDARGQFYVGRCYDRGQGVSRNYRTAVDWYRRSAQQNDPYGQLNLGNCYEWGNGVERNYAQAFSWYQKAADQGEPLAIHNLGLMYKNGRHATKNAQKAASLFRQAADLGEPYGQLALARCYQEGAGVPKDMAEAVRLVTLAAEQNLGEAQEMLGNLYYRGEGVQRDYIKAITWLRKADTQGCGYATAILGDCYARGEGVTQNLPKAMELYEKSLLSGSSLGLARLFEKSSQLKPMTEADCQRIARGLNGMQPHMETILDAYAKLHGRDIAQQMLKYPSTSAAGQKLLRRSGSASASTAQSGSTVRSGGSAGVSLSGSAPKEINSGIINSLMVKYKLDGIYLRKGHVNFQKKLAKAMSTYAFLPAGEVPLLMADMTVFGSAKEGFVLSNQAVYHNGGLVSGKQSCRLEHIAAVEISKSTDGRLNYVDLRLSREGAGRDGYVIHLTYTSDANLAQREKNFWKELLNL